MPEKNFTPLLIFISYGRDEFADYAERLKEDLEARGHDVWFDKDRLREGRDWEAYINEGLDWVRQYTATGRVIFIVTPHSVRLPDGYCLNEIAKALTLSVPIVPVMFVNCEPPLSLYRLQYLDMQDCYPPHTKTAQYSNQLERLVHALEDQQLDLQGAQSRFLKVLEPISLSSDVSRLLDGLTGRKWVFSAVEEWLKNSEGTKLF